MAPANTPTPQSTAIAFLPWLGVKECSYDIGSISYGLDGAFKLELLASETEGNLDLSFETPLAIRITQEGSLMDYWNSGFVVQGHNVFVATSSQFLDWLEHSSSGVHSAERVKHFAVFTVLRCSLLMTQWFTQVEIGRGGMGG